MLDRFELPTCKERLDDVCKRSIYKENAILCVVCDVRDLIRKEAKVDGMQDRAQQRCTIVSFA